MCDNNDLQNLHDILNSILNPNNEIRKEAELKLNSLQSNRTLLIVYLSKIIPITNVKGVKNLCCLLLNKYLSAKTSLNTDSVWKELGSNKEAFKLDVLNAFLQEKDSFIKKKICDLIANISECVFEADEKWDDLSKLIIHGISLEVTVENLVALEAQVYFNQFACIIRKLF